jgi:acyl dehydratase
VAVEELTTDPAGNTLRAAFGLVPRSRKDTLPDLELIRRGVTVDRDHLARYDRVCGFRLNDVLPATYPHVLAFPLAMRLLTAADFPLPAIGLVHVANRITVLRPVTASQTLDISVRAADLRPHDRGRQVDLHATISAGGEPVWTSVSTYLSKESPGERRGKRAEEVRPAASAVWRVPARTGSDYAAVSGDHNPIHTSRIGARLFGFPRPIAHGMWSKARCLAFFEGRLPEAYTVEVSFQQPILLPATVFFSTGPAGEFGLHGKRPHLAGRLTEGPGWNSGST